VDEMQIN